MCLAHHELGALKVFLSKHHLNVLTLCWAASRQAGCGCRAGRARRGRGAAPPFHDSWPPGDCATLGFQVCCLLLLAAPASFCFPLCSSLLLLVAWHCNADRLCCSCFFLLPAPFCFLFPAVACFLPLAKMDCRQASCKHVCSKSASWLTCDL